MDNIKIGLFLLVFAGIGLVVYMNIDTTAKVDVNTAEVLAQVAEQNAEMAAFRNGGKLKPELEARAKTLRQRAEKIAADAEVKKVRRDGVLDRLADWFHDILGTSES